MITNEIMDKLKDEANKILSPALGTSSLKTFNVDSAGNMPYHWKNSEDLFNKNTYNWINSNLKANTYPIELDQTFTNIYLDVLSKVNYSLSSTDKTALTQATHDSKNQELALVGSWKENIGPLEGKGKPIDEIIEIVCNKWADPKTTLAKLSKTTKIDNVLNMVPASGQPVLDDLGKWLQAIRSTATLRDNMTMNNGYLTMALDALKNPTVENGGMGLDEANEYVPSFYVTPDVPGIENAFNPLNKESNKINILMDIEKSTENEFSVKINGGVTLNYNVLDFLDINIKGNASYFQDKISRHSDKINIKMTFTGVTLMEFRPVNFDMSTQKYWYYTKPIIDAIQNGDKDVSGFKFSPKPQVDFSSTGPFGFLTGAAISNQPSMDITINSSDYRSIANDINQSASIGLSFLGNTLGVEAEESMYSHSATVNDSNETVTITLNPPKEILSIPSRELTAWVLGVTTKYPCS